MRSTVGGVGMPTGDGVTNSPSSPLISAMTPANELASTKFCLADAGREYLIYLPRGGAATVDVSAAKGDSKDDEDSKKEEENGDEGEES